MPDGFAIPLFYLIVAAIWAYVKMTTPSERRSALQWVLIAVFCFGTVGFIIESVKTGSPPVPSLAPIRTG